MRGDCLSCERLGTCNETDAQKVLKDYTCILYEPVVEPIYKARVLSMELYGELPAVQAMLERPEELNHEEENVDG